MDNALTHLSAHDPVMADLIARYPDPTFEKHTDYYRELASSIIGQQLSVKAARSIEARFVALFGDTFPSPEQILAKDIEELRTVGLSRLKARYIQDLAAKIVDGTVRFDDIDSRSNDEIITEITKVKGIGVWTVHMFLMFCMARPDVLPTGDLGIRNGVGKLYDFQSVPAPEEVTLIANEHQWHPYESVASWYIWQSLDNTPKA